jgi:ATP-dependent metalloprotease
MILYIICLHAINYITFIIFLLGFSGAELANLVNEASLRASVDGLKAVTMKSLEYVIIYYVHILYTMVLIVMYCRYAKDKIMMGAERVTAVISPDTLKTTAYHEAG